MCPNDTFFHTPIIFFNSRWQAMMYQWGRKGIKDNNFGRFGRFWTNQRIQSFSNGQTQYLCFLFLSGFQRLKTSYKAFSISHKSQVTFFRMNALKFGKQKMFSLKVIPVHSPIICIFANVSFTYHELDPERQFMFTT